MAELPPQSALVDAQPRSGIAFPAVAALVVTVAAESVVVVGGARLVGLPGLVLVLLASASWALIACYERFELPASAVVIAIGVAFAIAIAVPPRNSHDLWSYVMYGRAVSVYHVSPYVHAPSAFPHDAFLRRVASGWRDAKSVYGPLFTGTSAVLTRVAGSSALRARLAFQGLAALGVAAALALIWRTTRNARAVAFVGLHPAVVTVIVNGGHNDALVGLAIVAGALLATRRRWNTAGFVLGLGILVKASTGLGALGIAAWTLSRDRRGAVRLALAAGATIISGYLPAGISAVRAAVGAGNNGYTHVSVWDPISTLLHLGTTIAVVGVLLLAAFAARRTRAAARPTTTSLATTAAYLIAGAYVLPWYPAWALPTAALERRSRLSLLVAAHAAFLTAVYEYELPAHPTLTGVWAGVRSGVVQIAAWSALAVFALVLGMRSRALARVSARVPARLRPARS